MVVSQKKHTKIVFNQYIPRKIRFEEFLQQLLATSFTSFTYTSRNSPSFPYLSLQCLVKKRHFEESNMVFSQGNYPLNNLVTESPFLPLPSCTWSILTT
jgi:hypothetical protein